MVTCEELLFNGYGVCVSQDKTVLEMGCTVMCVWLTLLKCTLKNVYVMCFFFFTTIKKKKRTMGWKDRKKLIALWKSYTSPGLPASRLLVGEENKALT